MRRLALLAALLTAAALAGVAGADTPGVSSSTITLGGTAPISGEASSAAAVARGAEAYFKYVNDQGGVNGRKIDYKYLDDAYDPGRTVQDVRELIQQDNVFALFNTLGTAHNLAIRDFANQSGVPQLFVATGANTFGADYKKYPWTVGYIPSYLVEGTIYGRYVVKNMPKAKVGVLYQDDDYGRDLLNGLKKGLGGKVKIVSSVGYDPTSPDIQSQIAQIKASGADTLMVFAFGKFGVQSFLYVNKLGWRPKQIFVNAVAASANLMTLAAITSSQKTTDGTISIVFGKDPSDPAWAGDAGVKLFTRILQKYYPQGNVKDGYYIAGMASAYTMVDVLKAAGKDLTRDGVMKAALNLNEANNPFLVTGIAVKTSPTDHFPLEQVKLERWTNGHWTSFGPLVTASS